ncbi:DUF934 domain-containing protein [Halioxenophilus sp. WMMB6]|uniref:DUF934 domain-containing protein n=1 Tax=Halioxenophilus sp. WMMB6 TaxID=3073815 RepID=UPI00295E3B26|nr:DUF934 domain-containing protein [Halioxenophilus sp. WMMB6]
MPKLIKDGVITANQWQRLDRDAAPDQVAVGQYLIPLALWSEQPETWSGKLGSKGLTITSTDTLESVGDQVNQFSVIEVYFPAFMDGRGFSLGRLLRERYGFTGELRASGKIIRDQLCYLRRCGFNAFAFDDETIDLETAITSLNDFTDGYQASVDQPLPLFMRRG